MTLKDKIAVVTGAGRGIGRGIALRFGQEGAKLALADIDRGAVESVAEELRQKGCTASVQVADLSRVADARDTVRRAAAEYGRIDILVNNAGGGGPKPILEITPDEWDAMFNLNVKGLF